VTYQLKRFMREDYAALTDTPERDVIDVLGSTVMTAYEQAGSSLTLYANGQRLCCGGLYRLWPGVAEAWIAVSADAHKHPVAVVRYARSVIDEGVRTWHLTRVHSHVRADFMVARKFMEHLGFELESTLPKFGPDGSDYVMYRRLI
jgi:hypothetical protein